MLLPRILLLATCYLALPISGAATDRPDIFVFLTDDLSARDVGVYGATNVRTPAFDALAAEGMAFDRAFVISPACAPSRAAMLTGLTPAHNGAEANHTYMRDDAMSLIPRFKELGYQIAAFGKVAHGKDAARHGFDHFEHPRLDSASIDNWLSERDPDRPVLLFVGTVAPHVPWPANDGYDPAKVVVPPFHIDTADTRLFRARYYTDVTSGDTDFARTREIVTRHLGEDVLTVMSSDHGAQWPFGKWSLYDEGIRVPLIISWPGHIETGTRSGAMVSWLDLLPTLLHAAGGILPDNLDGRSFVRVLRDSSLSHRDLIFTTHDNDGRQNVYPIRSVRSDRWKYIRNLQPSWVFSDHSYRYRKDNAGAYFWSWEEAARSDANAALILNRYLQRPAEELYNLQTDPDELNNLAADPGYADILVTLRDELDVWMKQQGDDGEVEPEPWLPGQPDLLEPRSFWPPFYSP